MEMRWKWRQRCVCVWQLLSRVQLSDPVVCPWGSPSKNTRVGSHSLFQGIFLTQGQNPDLLHCGQILYHLSPDVYRHICVYISVCVCIYIYIHIYMYVYIYIYIYTDIQAQIQKYRHRFVCIAIEVQVYSLQLCHFIQDLMKCPNSSTETNVIFQRILKYCTRSRSLSVPAGGFSEQIQWLAGEIFSITFIPKTGFTGEKWHWLTESLRALLVPKQRAESVSSVSGPDSHFCFPVFCTVRK